LAQLVIVSNRVAIPEKNAKARAGGLEVAVKAALKHKSGIWFGWSGKVAPHTKIATQRVMHDGITYITLDLSKEDHHEYYNGFRIACYGRSCITASISPNSRAEI
jgi:trehalose 6-phosphate synthase